MKFATYNILKGGSHRVHWTKMIEEQGVDLWEHLVFWQAYIKQIVGFPTLCGAPPILKPSKSIAKIDSNRRTDGQIEMPPFR